MGIKVGKGVVVGSVLGVRVERARVNGWTRARRAAFLDHLAVTCNVTAAAGHAGMSTCGAWALKRRDPVFARLWAEALEAGYEVLQTELLRRAIGAGDNPDDVDGERAPNAGFPANFDADLAMKLLIRRDRAVDGRGHVRAGARAGGALRTKRVPIEEVEAILMKRLDAIERRLKRQREGGGA